MNICVIHIYTSIYTYIHTYKYACINIYMEVHILLWLFFFTYAAVVYVSHIEDRFFNTPRL
jgi:hypothetical protein